MKSFNTTGVCIPEKHYMVNIDGRIRQIGKLVDEGKYITINRARQYGKTTTLAALRNYLTSTYSVMSLDFQGISASGFDKEQAFVQELSRMILGRRRNNSDIPQATVWKLENIYNRNTNKARLGELFDCFSEWCELSEKKVVLLIDEVDSATNNQVFLDFLGQLREGYIGRDTEGMATFQSVILAGVTDVKHLKTKMRDDDYHRVNSPWNIAADFDVDMSLSENGIEAMLEEYERDHDTGMNASLLAKEIREYTDGYPFLVSRICQIMDEKLVPAKVTDLKDAWTKEGFNEALKLLLAEKNTLFESLAGKLTNYPDLRTSIRNILMLGTSYAYNPLQESINQLEMYGFIKNRNNQVVLANRIFETLLYNLFLSDAELQQNRFSNDGALNKSIFIKNGILDMPLILERFIKNVYRRVWTFRG